MGNNMKKLCLSFVVLLVTFYAFADFSADYKAGYAKGYADAMAGKANEFEARAESDSQVQIDDYTSTDEFGDVTVLKGYSLKTDQTGTYTSSSTSGQSGQLKWNILILVSDQVEIVFRLYENGKTNTNLSTAYYTSDTYKVNVKDESDEVSSFTGQIYKINSIYNSIFLSSDSFFDMLVSGQKLRISISNNNGSYTLGTFDTSVYSGALYPESQYKNGDKGPAGGLVFYDCDLDNYMGNKDGLKSSECGWRYLEAAPTDLKHGSDVFFVWGDVGEFGTQTGIGTGKTNTAIIVSKASKSRKTNAATLCNDYTYGGYDDWFLPSIDELNQMYTNLQKKGQGGFDVSYYWSSSESNGYADYAWLQHFGSGGQHGIYRSYDYRVRPVRAF